MKRLHPISGVNRTLIYAIRVGAFGFFAGMILSGPLAVLPFAATFVIAPVAVLLGAVYGIARYYRFSYDLSDGTLSVNSGVLDRQQREIPLGRIQNVDIERGVVQRLFGLAVVNFETAGGSATEAVLNAVTEAEANELQAAVARYRRGEEDGETEASERSDGDSAETSAAQTVETDEGATQPRQRRLYELSGRDLLVLALLSFRLSAPAVVLFGVPFGQEYALQFLSASVQALGGPAVVSLAQLPTYSTGALLLIGSVALVEFVLAAWLLSAAFTMTEYYGFRLDYVGDDLRYQRGLIQQYSGSIPLEKVQTVTVRENALMRQFGYAALAVETAGYAPGSGSQEANNTAIPLDDRGTVEAFAEALTDAESPEITGLPTRSRRRYAVRYSLVPLGATAALAGVDTLALSIPFWYAPLALVPLTALAGHLTWRHRGYALLAHRFATRSGFLVRRTRLVPYYRLQTVIGTRSLFQRRLSLASVTADTASTASLIGGDATAYDIDDATAREVHQTLRTRLMDDRRRRADERDGHSLETFAAEIGEAGKSQPPTAETASVDDDPSSPGQTVSSDRASDRDE
jgi:putative membrane protein